MWQGKQKRLSVMALVAMLLCMPSCVAAQSSSSSNYRVDQTFFGSGGELNACSGNYCAKQTAGELSVGNTCSTGYCAQAGFNTTDDPFLEFVVTNANIDLNYLDTASVKTANGTFSVRAWESGGYVVRTEADSPTNTGPGAQHLTPLTTAGPSVPGTEQFGINLVKNTNFCGAGCDLGANPQQVPDSTFSFGQAYTGYDSPGNFKYNKGDIIARSLTSTSITTYTISYIFNINNSTPSGQYTFRHTLVATATY